MEFKDKLKYLREKNDISQYKLASDLFVSRSSVARWENGLGFPSDDVKERLTTYFGVSIDYFDEPKDEIDIIEKRWRKKKIQNQILHVAAKVFIVPFVITCIILITLAIEKGYKAKNSPNVHITTNDTVYTYAVSDSFGVGNCDLIELHSASDTPSIPKSIFVLTGLFKEKYNVKGLTLSGFDYKNVHIPSNIERIKGYARHYKSITVDKNNLYYDSRENSNCLIETSTNKLIAASDFNSFVPNSIKTIGSFSFMYTPYERIILPEGVEVIEESAFQEMLNLKELILPKSIKKVESDAFSYSNIPAIYYVGNETEFSSVLYHSYSNPKVYYYGEYEPAKKDKYWHYVNGIPTIWR